MEHAESVGPGEPRLSPGRAADGLAPAAVVPTGLVRPVRPGDVEVVFELIAELAEYERSREQVDSTPADLTAALFGDRPALFGHVIEHDGVVVGFALWFLNFSTWAGKHGIYLEDLYVRPQFRRHGYGRALLAELARICTERGYARLEWWVLDWNEPALAFYRQLGAIPMDEWTVHRLTGEPLNRLGNPWAGGDRGGPGARR